MGQNLVSEKFRIRFRSDFGYRNKLLPIYSPHLIETADNAFVGRMKDEITHLFSKSSIFFFWLKSGARSAFPGNPLYTSHFFSLLLSPPPLTVV